MDKQEILDYLRKTPENTNVNIVSNMIDQLPQGGTEVIANPELVGTEDDLTGLQVGETKYKVSTIDVNPSSYNTPVGYAQQIKEGDTTYNVLIPTLYHYDDNQIIKREYWGPNQSGGTTIENVMDLFNDFSFHYNAPYIISITRNDQQQVTGLEYFVPDNCNASLGVCELYSKTHKMTITPTSASDMTPVVTITDIDTLDNEEF